MGWVTHPSWWSCLSGLPLPKPQRLHDPTDEREALQPPSTSKAHMDGAPWCSVALQGSDIPRGWQMLSWCRQAAPSHHILPATHPYMPITHLQARRSLGSRRASKTLEKSIKGRKLGSESSTWTHGLTQTSYPTESSVGTNACPTPTRQCFPITHRGTGWSRVSMATLLERERAR